MNQLENPIETKAVQLVWELLGIKGSKLVVPGETGYPDRLFWLPHGRPFLIEFKRPGEEPRPKQVEIHDELKTLGYLVEVHNDPYEAVEAIISYLETTRLPKASRKILDRARSRCALLRSRVG